MFEKGLSFPLTFEAGQLKTEEGVKKVLSNIRFLFDTEKGSVFMNRRFGSKLKKLVFEEEQGIFEALAYEYIHESLNEWIPEVEKLLHVAFRYEGNTVTIDIKLMLTNGMVVDMEYDMTKDGGGS